MLPAHLAENIRKQVLYYYNQRSPSGMLQLNVRLSSSLPIQKMVSSKVQGAAQAPVSAGS